MSRYDGLIIPRSYSEYINKTDAATLQQALQLSGVMDATPTVGSNKPVKSGGVYTPLSTKVEKAEQVGSDRTTVTRTLTKGVYLYLTNLHPLAAGTGLYLISVASAPNLNCVRVLIADTTLSNVSISNETNEFTVTATGFIRGELIKITDTAAV